MMSLSPLAVAKALDGVDGCFTSPPSPRSSAVFGEWAATHRANLTGTVLLLDQIRRMPGASRIPFVYASSAAVYGDCDLLPLTETAYTARFPPMAPISSGANTRPGSGPVHGIPTLGLRFFNVYGPRQDPKSPYSGVISIFCDRLRAASRRRVR